MRFGALIAVVGLSAACTTPSGIAEQTETSAIYHGTAEVGEPWAVAVSYQRPNTTRIRLCTGSVIGPRAVLTAKHCVFDEPTTDVWVAVDVSTFVISVGYDYVNPGGIDHTVGATEVITTPGVYSRADREAGNDIAVLRLDADIGVAPKPVSRTAPVVGDSVEILGFGYTETDELGVKHKATVGVDGVAAGVLTTSGAAWTCSGDSGGPALHAGRNQVLGITSYGPANCATSLSYYTRVDKQLALIDGALGIDCVPQTETCNGLDDNCDGVVDEGCAGSEAGAACDAGSCGNPPGDTGDDPGGCCDSGASASGSGALALSFGVMFVLGLRRGRRRRAPTFDRCVVITLE